MRPDFLALTFDDLVLLANRGLARRAQQELQAGDLAFELTEDTNGTVVVRWSDDVECVLPGGQPAAAGRCSCPATTLCRHILRSVLAYQAHAAEVAPQTAQAPWDPGAIDDTALVAHISRSALSWARRTFDEGQVAELVRAVKPSAYLHSLACTVRFLVPDDIRYTHCDCAEPGPCRHVAIAVWAFRKLAPAVAGGIVETAPAAGASADPVLDDLDEALRGLVIRGVAGASQPLVERLRRIEQRLRAAGYIWPADALADLVAEYAAYAAHDARFNPAQVALLAGELCIRADAIRANTGAVPQLFVRGAATDRETTVGAARLIGLGCAVQVRRGGVRLAAYVQDADSGALMVVRRDVADPDPATGPAAPFARLALAPIARGVSIAGLSEAQTLVKGGRRLPNGTFVLGRAPLSLNPQAYAWETLRPPVMAESFAELAARLAVQPPAPLRPRRLTDGLFVCAVAGVNAARFEPATQTVQAIVRDADGATAALAHPYTARGQAGVELLLAQLQTHPADLRFVAGHVRLTPGGPVIAPTALVFQHGSERRAVLPWVAQPSADAPRTIVADGAEQRHSGDPIAAYWDAVGDALEDLFVVGLGRSDARVAERWQALAAQGKQLGFGRSVQALEHLAAELQQHQHTLHWDAAPAAALALAVACLGALVGDAVATDGR